MSKKRGNGHTMTLKDFHGGSIPSDLPLPSAPGLTVKTSDRSGYERPSSRGNPIGPSDHRSLLHNSALSWHFDDKTPFLTNTAPVGSNFDEDERKPLGSTSAPRRTINSEGVWGPPSHVEVKSGYGLGGNSLGPKVVSGSQYRVGNRNSYSARLTEASHVGMDSQNLKGSSEQRINGASPNVWAMRKNVASTVKSDQSAWSDPNAFSKLAHANAIDKVSSGRWQSKKVHSQMDFEIGTSSEVESRLLNVNGNSTHNKIDMVDEKRYSDVMLARHAERSLAVDDQIQGRRNELLEHERCGTELQQSVAFKPSEQPKLNLSRRTKPLDSEPSVADNVQLWCQGSDSSHVETVNEAHVHANIVNSDSTRTESRKEERQRPKLILKRWSPSLEKLEGNTGSDRNALFGGARPRELVLKERGVDDAAINNYGAVDETNRVEYDRPKKLSDHSMTHYFEKTEDTHQRPARKPERRDQWVDAETRQRRNWLGDNRKNMRPTDRQASPEMCRKPIEQQKPKATSAVERAQQPFSRLVGPTPKNG